MAPVIPDPSRIRAFPDQKAFEIWLSAHHGDEPELWLKIFKKGSGTPTVTYQQAVEVALCWGWIDGIKKSFDDAAFLQRFSPRKPKSIWSQVNREHVARMVAEGRMTEHGLKHVEAAKADGRWDAAYASASKTEMPADLMAAIEASPKALETFGTLNGTNRFALAFRVGNLKTQKAREAKIKTFVAMLERGETPHPQGKAGS